MNNTYKDKVRLLLRILPTIMDEQCFAVHGGTAINLFISNMLQHTYPGLVIFGNLRDGIGMGDRFK